MNALMLAGSRRAKSLLLLTALIAMPAALRRSAQAPAPVRAPALPRSQSRERPIRPAPDAPAPGDPDFAPDQPEPREAAPAPAPLPPAVWDVASAQDLLRYIEQVGAEGLDPADYDPTSSQTAIAGRPGR